MKVVNSTEKYSNIDANVLNVVTNNSSVVNTNTLNTETITANTFTTLSADVDSLSLKSLTLNNINGLDSVLNINSDTSTSYVQIQSDLTADTFGSVPQSKNESQVVHTYKWKSSPSIETNSWYSGVAKDQVVEGSIDEVKYCIGTGNTISNSKLVIDRTGNVGIGTTTPANKLQVNGDVNATNFLGNFVGTFSGVFNSESDKLTGNSDTSFLTARVSPYTLADGSVTGTNKTIILNSSANVTVPESFTELLDTSNDRNGIYSIVYDIKYDQNNNDLYVVGNVQGWRDQNGGIGTGNIRRIAKFDFDTSTWSVLADINSKAGTDNIIFAAELINGRLFLGGEFTSVVDQNNSNGVISRGFAEYDISSNTFNTYNEPFGNNNSVVLCMTILNSVLYVGGRMSIIGSLVGSKVLQFDLVTNTFSRTTSPDDILYNGGNVHALTNDSNTKVYAGGESTMKIGSSTNVHGVAVFDTNTNTWSGLTGVGGNSGIGSGGIVYALAYYNNILYVGGSFTTLQDGTPVNRFATFDTLNNIWSSVPNSSVLNNNVRALEVLNGKIIIGGDFTNKMYVYDPTDDTFTVPNGLTFNIDVESLFTLGGDVYVGGGFFTADGSGVVKYTPESTSILTSANINGSLHENGSVTGSKTLNFVGEKLNLLWNGTHWFV